ncbi:OmpH family outer membrane protein [Thiohalobacter thiocyanaticus]|uniref:OmpH family outer membrane protein n=1 Tax=Thiohalobacter thiocyanaticus TaxID=585455 RepID=A0A426QE64_9GAMM|nr:OmpH family outer membrane protein [Thiohalobacter thiocyanaticus]RRQ20048.1 OmpH family outer membrane protein [Thiohalobacter thiocyanaticus]
MIKLMRIFALSLLVLPLSVLAEVKVGFVNTSKLMEEAPQAQSASKQMETEFAPREKELISLQREIKQMEDKLARDGAVMSESERNKAERELLNQKRDLKRSQDEFREDLNIRRNELLSQLQKELNDAIVALAKEEGYDLVLFEGVVFASDRIDITDAVLERLRRQGN